MRTIILCKGVIASGKTTWAYSQLYRYPGKYKRINRDELRLMLDQGRYDPENEKFIYGIKKHIIEISLKKGFDVIVDDTNLKEKDWINICEIAKKIGDIRVFEKFFPVTLKESLKRNEQREKPIPAQVVYDYFDKYIRNKRIEVRDLYFPIDNSEYIEDPTKDDAVIVDVDGTLALIKNRSPYNLDKILEDEVNIPIKNMVNMLSTKFSIIIVSGREDRCLKDTKLWLDINEIHYSLIYLRKTDDRRTDSIVKEEIYNEHIKPYYNIKYVLDDRQQTVDLWRRLKLCCLQVADGNF